MLTYSFENRGEDSLYEYLYEQIKKDISEMQLPAGTRLPSKRSFSRQLGVSTITVENAYELLLAEGYIYSVPRSGYFVSSLSRAELVCSRRSGKGSSEKSETEAAAPLVANIFASLSGTTGSQGSFPFSVWARLIRKNMTENRERLLAKAPSQGIYELRLEIARWLREFRGMEISPEQIVVGAGTEYLYGLLTQLLGRDKTYAVEEPGYLKIGQIYSAQGMKVEHVTLDGEGVSLEALEAVNAQILHISPAHHFPTGIITSIGRRLKLLEWAAGREDRYIIEDDYDSEFRMSGKPMQTMFDADRAGKVIYVNTFSKSLAQTIRISYMVLPEPLMEKYRSKLGFYSCTVSNIEQFTLADFMKNGYFEKHINRMRTRYRNQRNRLMKAIRERAGSLKSIKEEHAGLHFLLYADTQFSDEELIRKAAANGITISMLSSYYQNKANAPEHVVIVNYSDIEAEKIEEAVKRLFECF